MRLKRLSKLLFATGGALMLVAGPAGAHSGHTVTFTATDYTLDANAGFTSSIVFGANEVDTMEVDLPAGVKLAHDDQHGNELASNPNDDAWIGSGSAKAAFVFSLCGTTTVGLDVYFEEDMTGAPANAVAHYRIVASSVGTYHGWAIEQNDSTNDYKITIDLDQTWTCSSQPADANSSLTINASGTGGVVSQNPSASGCYTSTANFVAVGGGTHSGSSGRNFPGGTTC